MKTCSHCSSIRQAAFATDSPLRHLHGLDLHIHVRGQVYGYLQQNALAAGGLQNVCQRQLLQLLLFLFVDSSSDGHDSTWPQPPHLIVVFPQGDVAEVRNRLPQVHLWPANPNRFWIERRQKLCFFHVFLRFEAMMVSRRGNPRNNPTQL